MTANATCTSPVEIAQVLEDLAGARIPIHAELEEPAGPRLFTSRVLWVEPDCSGFTVAYDADDTVNGLLYRQGAIKFNADRHHERISFFAHTPLDTMFQGKPAIYFPIPPSLMRYRRRHQRIAVPAEAGLRCVVTRDREAQLEMKVVDISEGGMGCVIHSETEPFVQGAVLRQCRLVRTGGKPVWVVLAVEYSMPAMLPDGAYVQRAGLRFLEPPPEIRTLTRQLSAGG